MQILGVTTGASAYSTLSRDAPGGRGCFGGGVLTHSEVGGGEGVGGMAVLADDGGGVALLAAVLALPPVAGDLADGGGEDHLDAAGVVPHCQPGRPGEEQEAR